MAPLTTFHPFRKLPWEIRNEIWKLSVRPLDRPGAHIFCLELRESKDGTAKECDVQHPPIPVKTIHYDHPGSNPGKNFIHITVPAKTLSSGPAGNPSAYMIDGGLWTACKESRAVMERVFNHEKWDPIRKAYPAYRKLDRETQVYLARESFYFDGPVPPPPRRNGLSPLPPRPQPQEERLPRERPPTPVDPYDAMGRDYFSVPATAFFWSSHSLPSSSSNGLVEADSSSSQVAGSPHYFTVRPMLDLIIIRPTPWKSHLYLSEGYWHAFEHGFPFGAKKYGFRGFCGGNGFAIEYDPSWGLKPEFGTTWRENSLRGEDGSFKLPDGAIGVFDIISNAIQNFSEHEQIQTIWLIDYRLKPKPGTPAATGTLRASQRVFHGGDGCRFVEMYSRFVPSGGDHLNGYYTEGIDGENSAMGQGSCHWFIQAFEDSRFGDHYDSDDSTRSEYSRYLPYVGLLACLP